MERDRIFSAPFPSFSFLKPSSTFKIQDGASYTFHEYWVFALPQKQAISVGELLCELTDKKYNLNSAFVTNSKITL